MNEENAPVINYIFYLQTKNELDNSYHILAEVLSKINISLLPISADDLKVIDRNKKHHLISIRNDFSSAFNFNQMRKSFLDTAMAAGKIALFDISSFSEIENAAKFQNKNMYRYFQLPQNLKQVAMTVAVDYFRDRNSQVEWPGGRRAKLPSMTNET
ncbi:MAG: hypothetical protein H7281_10725 [Bacteriovorax sp.]|nr:hypothetical protein [Bacteriovorax sp.]